MTDESGTARVHAPQLQPGDRWQPEEGNESRTLVSLVFPPDPTTGEPLSPMARGVLDASVSILAGGIAPNETRKAETGLIAGYVQSGKTLSFTTVAALARDNAFHIVIILTGTSTNLFDQSTRRLRSDLRLDQPRERKWLMLPNPREENVQAVRNIVREWRDAHTPEDMKRTCLIAVMKHHDHLQHLRRLLGEIDLSESPVLIIDDEADQASMNTRVNQSEESTTYRRISELRAVIPNHTYLQYTATPQAPLLINIIDTLSPNFVRVLEPGQGYVGGQQVFVEHRQRLVVEIPANEVATDPSDQDEPPPSLIEALRIFILGVAAQVHRRDTTRNRSMLIHPSQRRNSHSIYYGWVSRLVEHWNRILEQPDSEPAQEILEGFRPAYANLAVTAPDLPSFDELCAQRSILIALRDARVREVNTRVGATQPIPWSDNFSWILVAGQAVDRGFTVEGLTVTYMPRGLGVGNADTIQQRGRFFGYKQSYLGYCRMFLSEDSIEAFEDYVEHEENIRGQLREFQRSGRPLNEWKRAFIMEPQMRPTRSAVLDLDYMRGRVSNGWATPLYPNAPDEVLESNRWTVRNFLAELDLVENAGHRDRTATQRHLIAEDVPLGTVLEDLLLPYRVAASSDSQRFTGLMLQLRRAIDRSPDELCSIVQMSPQAARGRGLDVNGRITYLFQGQYPVESPGRGSIYRGDQSVHAADRVTVQCHSLRLTDPNDVVLNDDVQVLAVWVPTRLGAGWVVQDGQ